MRVVLPLPAGPMMAVKLPLGRSTLVGWSKTFSVRLPRGPTMTAHLRTMHRPGRNVPLVKALRPVVVSTPREDDEESEYRRALWLRIVDSSPVSITPSFPTAFDVRYSVTAPPNVCSWTPPARLRALCNCSETRLLPKPPSAESVVSAFNEDATATSMELDRHLSAELESFAPPISRSFAISDDMVKETTPHKVGPNNGISTT